MRPSSSGDRHLLRLGVVGLLLLSALAVGCARSQPLCGPSNCTGCCNGQSECVPGTSPAACGQQGFTCRSCGPTDFCSPMGCVARAATTTCGPQTCTGCCQADGGCVPAGSLSSATCGRDGERCAACATAAGQTCDVTTGRCGGCTGCETASGACNPLLLSATDRRACGAGGRRCVDCGASGTCSSGICSGGCDGCRSGSTCVPAVVSTGSPRTCGLGGVACAACADGWPCQAGRCVPPSDAGFCPGCRLPNGPCVPAVVSSSSNSTCGVALGGVELICLACSGGSTCVGGRCVADAGVRQGRVGDPCVDVRECFATPGGIGSSGLVQQPQCKTAALGSSLTYPGGMCTRRCLDSVDCGDAGVCAYFLGASGERENVCLAGCRTSAECRGGYTCLALVSGESGCFPASHPLLDAGPRAQAPAGAACTADTVCGAAGSAFRCQAASTDAGLPTGFVGGACTGDCALAVDRPGFCGGDGECVPFTTTPPGNLGPLVTWDCRATCTFPVPMAGGVRCRPGYVCNELSPGSGFAICEPHCANPGYRCPFGFCDTSTGLCQ